MVKKYVVSLSESERQYLEQFTKTGKHAAYQINHAQILLKADRNQPHGSWCDTFKDLLPSIDTRWRRAV